MLPHNRLCPVPNPHLRTAGNVGVYRLGAEHGRGSPRDRRLGSLPPPRLQFAVPPFRLSSAAKYFGKVADDAITRRGLSRSEDGTGATASMGAAQPGVCVCFCCRLCLGYGDGPRVDATDGSRTGCDRVQHVRGRPC